MQLSVYGKSREERNQETNRMTLNVGLSHSQNTGNSKGQISPVFQQINGKGKMREKEVLQFKWDLRDVISQTQRADLVWILIQTNQL